MPAAPAVFLLSLREYVERARADGVRSLALGYLGLRGVVAWRFAARAPWYGRRLLTHEWWHATTGAGNEHHAPWYTFRVECGHALRFRDPDGLLVKAAPWVEAWR